MIASVSIAICTIIFGCIVATFVGARIPGSAKSSFPLPPGPPRLPWVGNVVGINGKAPWLTYSKWAKTYGDIVYSRLLGKDIIIINSEKIAKELLENRASNTSDRPQFIITELAGMGFLTALLPYGNKLRLHRQFFHQIYRPDALSRLKPLQHVKTCQLLRRLLEDPEQLDKHLFEYIASVILQSTYDYDPASQDDELFEMVAKVVDVWVPVLRPDTAVIIGTFPMLLSLPSWLPGMSFKREISTARKFSEHCVETAFKYAWRRVQTHRNATSMVHDAMLKAEHKGIEPDEEWMTALKHASGTSFTAGVETSDAVLKVFVLMMMLNPLTQEKAQAQIDAVVGRTRLPTANDRPLLTYIEAIYRETLRFSPVVPLGVPHATVEEEVFRGFRIPKGAIILPNLWSMAHDEVRYSEPDNFMAERWFYDDGTLKPNDTEHLAFGFGRRACVGRHFAEMSVWTVMARILAVFKILKPLDETGAEVDVEPAFTSGIAIHPQPFPYRIVPRILGMDIQMLEQIINNSTE